MGAADFQACLFHLMQNAIRSMDNPGTILLHIAHDRTHLTATLSDQGRGMSPQELQHALDPFVQNRDRPADAGLGLPFVRALLEESDGSLELESSPLQGTRALLRLPLR